VVNETSPGVGDEIIAANAFMPEVVEAVPFTVIPVVTRLVVTIVSLFSTAMIYSIK
jgi:hypothetical protein